MMLKLINPTRIMAPVTVYDASLQEFRELLSVIHYWELIKDRIFV
jgi:hypothetical protein